MPYETKKYQQAYLFLNEFLSTHIDKLETDFDLESKEDELKSYPADDNLVWYIKKISLWDNWLNKYVTEFRVDYHNIRYLFDNQQSMTKKEFTQRKITKSCYIYIVDENLKFIPTTLLKNKYNKVKRQFIHDKYWFKDFTTKNMSGFLKI